MALPSVRLRARAGEEAALGKAAQDAAEITRVEAEVARDVGGGGGGAVGKLVEHARLGERERALVQPLAQHADVLGVEAGEPPHRRDALLGHRWLDRNLVHWVQRQPTT